MSARKRELDGSEPGPSESKKNPKFSHIPDKEALGVYPIHHNYKPYSILNRFIKDKSIVGSVELHKNTNKSRELLEFLLDMGNTHSFKAKTAAEVEEAIDYIFERDHGYFKRLLSGEITLEEFGTLFFPEIFFSRVPWALNPVEWTQKKEAAIKKGIPHPKVSDGVVEGDFLERKIYDVLKNYFEDNKDACFILHGHSFLHEDNFRGKDFIVLNLSKGYIMNIEGKPSHKHFNTAKEQVQDCRKRIQAVFNGIKGMSSLWKFVGVCFIGKGGDNTFGKDFVINGSDDIATELTKIEQQVHNSYSPQWIPNQDRIKEFVNVAKFLLFEAQGQSRAPLTKQRLVEEVDKNLEKASSLENIFFWSPQQLSVVEAMDVNWMVLMGYFGTGKTILLLERAEYLLRNPNPANVIHFYIDNGRIGSLLEETLRLRFSGKPIKVKTGRNIFQRSFNFEDDGVNLNDHVIIDESYLTKSDTFIEMLAKFQKQVSTLWLAIGQISKSMSTKESQFIAKLEEIQFFTVTLEHCLRNQSAIVELAKPKLGALSHFKEEVKFNKASGHIDGIINRLPQIHSNPLSAVQKALDSQGLKASFIYIQTQLDNIDLQKLRKECPDHSFFMFEDKEERLNWLESSVGGHLVFHGSGFNEFYENGIAGMEFQSMIYVYQACKKCEMEEMYSDVITRAKASLTLAKYMDSEFHCNRCFEEDDIEQDTVVKNIDKKLEQLGLRRSNLFVNDSANPKIVPVILDLIEKDWGSKHQFTHPPPRAVEH